MTETKDEKTQGNFKISKKKLYILVAGFALLVIILATYFGYIYAKNSPINSNQTSQSQNQSVKQVQTETKPEIKEVQAENQPKVAVDPILVSERRSIAFQGKIGDLPVLMSLNFKDGEINGQYKYDSKDEDLQLSGKQDNGNLKLEETVYTEKEGMKKTGVFDGVYDGKSYIGKWKNDSKELEFSLNQIFNFTEKELEVGFDKECVIYPENRDVYNGASLENLVYSSQLKQYYFVVGVAGGGCNGSANRPWVLYLTKDGQKPSVLKDLSAESGMSTGGTIRISPNGEYLYVYQGTHGGICSNYNSFIIYDLLKNKVVFDSASGVDYEKTNGSFIQYFKKWVNNNEIEYYEFTNDCTDAANPIDKTIVKRAKF